MAWALVAWTLRERRRLAALVAGEALAASLVFYATINDRFYGGLTPRAAGLAGLPEFPLGYVERLPRLAGLWLDRDVGLLRWAPLLALVFFAGWLLYRSRRDQLARVAPARREAEACAGLLLGIIGAQLAVVALLTTGGLRGATFPGVPLVAALPAVAALTAWGLRHIPRPLAALLALFSLGASTWLVLAERSGHLAGWLEVDTSAPWGPPVHVFPNFTGQALLARHPVHAARRGRGLPVVARAPRGGRVAPRRRGVDAPQSAALTEFVTPTPPRTTRCATPSSVTVDALTRALGAPGPRTPLTTEQLADAGARARPVPARGSAARAVLEDLGPCSTAACASATRGRVAHLHPAPLIAAAAASSRSGVTNQSMDAFDASPAATFVEDTLVRWLAREHGLGEHGSGVMTMGGTASNLLGLLLARDRAGENVRRDGLPPQRLADRRLARPATTASAAPRRCSGSAPRP